MDHCTWAAKGRSKWTNPRSSGKECMMEKIRKSHEISRLDIILGVKQK
jgi:hypothetical protein